MPSDHKGNPVGDNSKAKTYAERTGQFHDDYNPTVEDELKYVEKDGRSDEEKRGFFIGKPRPKGDLEEGGKHGPNPPRWRK